MENPGFEIQSEQQPADAESRAPIVVKVGGSLLDLPGLGVRLRCWLDALEVKQVIVLVGGGATADVVRARDRLDNLGEEKSHWLAVRALTFNSFLLEGLLERSRVITHLAQCPAIWAYGRTPILDPHAFLVEDQSGPAPLPCNWQVTSDSIAARVARALGAAELILLKSVDWSSHDMAEAARQGIVDQFLPGELARVPAFKARIVNFRSPFL